MTCPNIPNNIRRRVDIYLSRIQHLRLTIGPPKETGAVSILSMALGVNPLLPKLKSLDLDFRQWKAVGTWIYAIGTLISPSLTSISYTAVAAAQFEGVMTVQSVLSWQALALSSIVYRGQFPLTLLGTCMQFRGLVALKLSNEPSNLPVQRMTFGVSIINVFENFQNLVDLEIDLRLLPLLSAKTRTVTPSPFLQTLSITGNSPEIGEFLAGDIKSSSLKSLIVVMCEPPNLAWKMACDKVATNFPQLHSLTFRRAYRSAFRQMLPQDLSSLTSRQTMRSLELNGISHCFTEADICQYLSSWPDLQTLSIINDYTIHFSASLLIHLSRADHLHTIKLPLDMSFLQDELLDDATPLTPSRITELTITDLASSPPSLEGKIKVAKNLLTLFPSLERVITHSTSSPHKTYVADLEELLRSFRSAVMTYLQKNETKRRLRANKKSAR